MVSLVAEKCYIDLCGVNPDTAVDKLKFNGGVNSMKIYALYHNESSEETVVCISENVEEIKKKYLKCAKIGHFLTWKYGKMEM